MPGKLSQWVDRANLALGAACTPLSLGADGKIYTQSDGRLFVFGN